MTINEQTVTTRIIDRDAHDAMKDRLAELERENAELRRENRLWEWRVESIVRLIDNKPLEEPPE